MKLKCMICYKPAEILAYGNAYCIEHYEKSEYYAERKVKKELENEKNK